MLDSRLMRTVASSSAFVRGRDSRSLLRRVDISLNGVIRRRPRCTFVTLTRRYDRIPNSSADAFLVGLYTGLPTGQFLHSDLQARPTAMPNIIKASVVQAATAAYSLPDTLDKLERFTRLAKERDGAQLVVFPEALFVLLSLLRSCLR